MAEQEQAMSLKVLFVSAEVYPYAKVGGLADVAGSLPSALKQLGHDVRVAMPLYAMVEKDPQVKLSETFNDLKVAMNPWWIKRAQLKETTHEDVPIWMLGTDEWFNESKASDQIYAHGVDAYLFFSRAVMAACERLGWIPDVVHCNDWHTGFLPVMIREQGGAAWADTGAVYTIHNLAYQGEFGAETLDKVALPRDLFNYHQLETFGAVNFLKSGCVFSDQTNTVSERYCQEIQTSEFGCRLDGVMRFLAEEGRLSGILNGIDPHEWNPATDLRIAANYDADHPQDKAKCREKLLQEIGLEPIPGAPVAGVVSRLSEQKGMHLMLQAAERLFELPIQLVVQGLGDPWLADQFEALQAKYPRHFRFAKRFDVNLAQHVYSGSDLFLMPSAFEPCGLGQLIALRYGTIPVVRRTGGLADTIFEGENGFVFDELHADPFFDACARAHAAYCDSSRWAALVDTALRQDHGWSKSAAKYVALYEKALAGRRSRALAS